MPRTKVSLPASVANLGPGFDCLSLAVNIRNEAVFEQAEAFSLTLEGEGAGFLSTGTDNPILAAYIEACRVAGREASPVAVHCRNAIPLGRGLGSSAAAVLAGLAGAEELLGLGLGPDGILDLAESIEGHADNAFAAYCGGLVLCRKAADGSHYQRLSLSRSLAVSILMPEEALPTEESRRVLTDTVPLADAVFNAASVGLLVEAMAGDRQELLFPATEDRLHQSRRLALVPSVRAAFEEAREAGLACGLSGAGPSLFVLHEADELPDELVELAERYGMRLLTPGTDRQGLIVKRVD